MSSQPNVDFKIDIFTLGFCCGGFLFGLFGQTKTATLSTSGTYEPHTIWVMVI